MIRTVSPSSVIDPTISDEKGYTSDIGVRGQLGNKVTFDASIYGLYYNDKIGEYETRNPNGSAAVVRYRSNIGTAVTYGFETMFDWSISKTFFEQNENFIWNAFSNITDSKYIKSDAPNIEGIKLNLYLCSISRLEQVLDIKLLTSVQLHVSSQYTEANNSITDKNDNTYGIFGDSIVLCCRFFGFTNGKMEARSWCN
jgi:Fe(3+) dicitrate transport protein